MSKMKQSASAAEFESSNASAESNMRGCQPAALSRRSRAWLILASSSTTMMPSLLFMVRTEGGSSSHLAQACGRFGIVLWGGRPLPLWAARNKFRGEVRLLRSHSVVDVNQLGERRGAHLRHHLGAMRFHRALSHIQVGRDLLVQFSRHYEFENF